MNERRITKFKEFINTIRNANEMGKPVQVKTEKVIAYMQRNNSMEEMYEKIEEDTKEMKREQRENTDRKVRDARNDFADLGIGEYY